MPSPAQIHFNVTQPIRVSTPLPPCHLCGLWAARFVFHPNCSHVSLLLLWYCFSECCANDRETAKGNRHEVHKPECIDICIFHRHLCLCDHFCCNTRHSSERIVRFLCICGSGGEQ